MDISGRSTLAAALASLAPNKGSQMAPHGAVVVNVVPGMHKETRDAIGEIARTLGYFTAPYDVGEALRAMTDLVPTLAIVPSFGTEKSTSDIQALVRLAAASPIGHAVCVISPFVGTGQSDEDMIEAVCDTVVDMDRAGSGREGVEVVDL